MTGVRDRPLRHRELRTRRGRRQARENYDLPVHLLEIEVRAREHPVERVCHGRRLAGAVHPVPPIREKARAEGDRDARLLGQERQRIRQRDAVHDNFRPLRQEPAVRPGP